MPNHEPDPSADEIQQKEHREGILNVNRAARRRAAEIFALHHGTMSTAEVREQLMREGYAAFHPQTLVKWRSQDRWNTGAGPEVVAAISRLNRASELRDVIDRSGGEAVVVETMWNEMLLASTTILEKLMLFGLALDPKKMKAKEAIELMKVMPPFIEKALRMRKDLQELRFSGSRATFAPKPADAAPSEPEPALDGEVIPPNPPDLPPRNTPSSPPTPFLTPQDVRPSLSDALSAISNARQADKTRVVDDPPPRRTTTRG